MTDLWQANWDAPRPFVHPLRTPAGAVLSTEAPDDHPWHHGLWSTIKFVDGENFWEEYDEFGLLHTTAVQESQGPGGPIVAASIEWRRPEGRGVVLDEVRTLAEVRLDGSSYALDWTVELTPRHDVVLDRTPYTTWGGYGGLTLRGAPNWTDTELRFDGDDHAHQQLRGEAGRWCHLQGVASGGDGPAVAGVAILDHPDNPRHPTPWYASTRGDTYGEGWANFVNAAFLWHEALEVRSGEALVLRHRVLVHDGAWSPDQVDDAWHTWTASA
jgi:hypothetical protein